MQRFYRVDVCDLWRGTLSLRKLRVLIAGLPTDCATTYAIAGVDAELLPWSLTNALLGRLVDEVSAHRWQWESSRTKSGRPARRAPTTVLPDVPEQRAERRNNVVPLVSPHKLGTFIDDDEGA